MEEIAFGVIALFILLFGLLSRKIENAFLTGPMIYMAFGYLLSGDVLGLLTQGDHLLVFIVAHITLILILFSDASRIKLMLFREEHDLPRRLLGIGLPLTICMGMIIGLYLFPTIPFWQVAVLATVLAPTDAALAQIVINSKNVPENIRRALNVESGLNDGICFPFLLMFLSLSDPSLSAKENWYWLQFIGLQLALGTLLGAVIGFFGGRLVLKSMQHGWMLDKFEKLSSVAVAFMAYFSADLLGGNGFIAVFVAGMFFGHEARKVLDPIYHFSETEGELFIVLTFMLFGSILIPKAVHDFDMTLLVYALLSLTVVRMIPVALSLIGKHLSGATILYLGWFGPRGAASILYLLIVLVQYHLSEEQMILHAATLTIILSVILHGVTAKWGSEEFARLNQD